MPVIEMIYGDFDDFWGILAAKNKAKQTQSQLAPRIAMGVEKTKPIFEWAK